MSSSPPFHFAILGLGNIARKFAEDLALIPDARLVAVGSRSVDRARQFATQFGAEHAAGSYEDTFTGPRVDAVYVATPHVTHRELAEMCLKKGIPVICEKPMGLNFNEVKNLASTARKEKTYLMEALWTRFLPSTLKLRELIDAGTIGEIQSIRSDFGFRAADLETALLQPSSAPAVAPSESGVGSRESGVGSRELGVGSRESGVESRESGVGSRESGVGSQESGVGSRESGFTGQEKLFTGSRNRILDPALGGGALLDIGIYPQFLSQFLLGEPEEIHATARLSTHGVDLDTSVTCRHAGGKLSHNYSTILGRTKTEALIIGTEGSIHWHPRWHEPSSFSILRGKNDPPENFYFDYEGANGYKYEALAVMDDVRNGRTENALWGLDESLALHRTLTEVRRMIGVKYPGE